MWLLSTDRAELHYFSSADVVDGGYAILSHTWTGHEQTLQEVRAIGERCRKNGTNPRDDPELTSKIRECCILAEKHGYRWVWIDSSCIDKTSSSELSEAINSMYLWYSQAEICYAYLADVPSDCKLHEPNSAFRRSRWHTRGWTLQELIAPVFVMFVSAEWKELGNRGALARLLHDITGIAPMVLTRDARPSNFSVSVLMYWASKRRTTRVEDEAYCLLGLFGVAMPTNYGEGRAAFTRLQYELLRHQTDTSLFTFGYMIDQPDFGARGIILDPDGDVSGPYKYLLASSPREFYLSTYYTPDLDPSSARDRYPPPTDSPNAISFDGIELPRITVTSYGVKCRLPVIEVDASLLVAVLLSETADHRYHLGLFLKRDPSGLDPKRPRYHTGCVYHDRNGRNHIAHTVVLGRELTRLQFNGKPVTARWRTIYVVPSPPQPTGPPCVDELRIHGEPTPPFRLPNWLVSRFSALRFDMLAPLKLAGEGNLSWMRLTFYQPWRGEYIAIDLGRCSLFGSVHPSHWADVTVYRAGESPYPAANTDWKLEHSCDQEHVERWTARSKDFGDAARTVRLSLTPCKRNPDSTLVVHIELFGRVYEDMLREANVAFPSLADLERGTLSSAHRPAVGESLISPPPRPLQAAHTTFARSPLTSMIMVGPVISQRVIDGFGRSFLLFTQQGIPRALAATNTRGPTNIVPDTPSP